MAHTVLAVSKLRHQSLLGRDSDQNSFVFVGEQASSLLLAEDIRDATIIPTFYNVSGGTGTHPICNYLGFCFDRSTDAMEVDFYNLDGHLDGSPHGSPILTSTFTLGPMTVGATQVPAECGVVITVADVVRASSPVNGPLVTTIPTPHRAQVMGAPATHSGHTRPKQSHTGRIYVGPVASNAYGVSGGETRVTAQCMADMGQAAAQILTNVAIIGTATIWSVWSRRLATTEAVAGGFVDDAPDIQRRRGVRPSAKTNW